MSTRDAEARALIPTRLSRWLIEAFAEEAHEAWSGWMRHLFGFGWPDRGCWVIPDEQVARWTRQMNTPYAQLTESEKKSDIAEVDRYLLVLRLVAWAESKGCNIVRGSRDMPMPYELYFDSIGRAFRGRSLREALESAWDAMSEDPHQMPATCFICHEETESRIARDGEHGLCDTCYYREVNANED